jgi:anti-sigma regulatory factor (Ser/Thr protein kinase)
VTLCGDEALLRRAVWNLVENVAKYRAPPITLAVDSEGDRVALTVSDEGPGIPAADRERVFAPFYRGERARTPGGHRGVGVLGPIPDVGQYYSVAFGRGSGAGRRQSVQKSSYRISRHPS